MNASAKYLKFYTWVLSLLAVAIPFRAIATPLLIIAVVCALPIVVSRWNSISYSRKCLWAVVIIASPFLLDVLFFWNNDSLLEAVKHGEKRSSLLILPLLFLSIGRSIPVYRILKCYAFLFPLLLVGLLIRYLIVFSENVEKYLNGIDQWQIGYDFANSTGVHAPALNLHIAFLCMVTIYFLLEAIFRRNRYWVILGWILSFLISFFFLIYINTRIAVLICVTGITLVVVWKTVSYLGARKAIVYAGILLVLLVGGFFAFAKANTYIIKRYTSVTFAHMDKVNRLDELEDPDGRVHGALVTRISIWNTALTVAEEHLPWGTGAADGKDQLNEKYKETDQQFLSRHNFPTHNQYLDFLMKFGVAGLLVAMGFHVYILIMGWRSKQVLAICFFLLFATANLTDDFLIRFDGIVFSAFWVSLFTVCSLKCTRGKDRSAPESSCQH